MEQSDPERLHIAASVEELTIKAKASVNDLQKIRRPTDVAKKLLTEIRRATNDELKYVFSYRFMKIYDHLLASSADKDYILKLFGPDAARVNLNLSNLLATLAVQYAQKRKGDEPVVPATPVKQESSNTVFNNHSFTTCPELYEILTKGKYNILVIDVRSAEQFHASHMKPPVKCINIPENIIHYGLSANILGNLIPVEFKNYWDQRDRFDAIVLMDWKSSIYNHTGTRLHKLKVILSEWDVNRTYQQKPIILDKGYHEYWEMYPTMCLTVDDSHLNVFMEDIIDLTDIDYPSEPHMKSNVSGRFTPPAAVPEDIPSLQQDASSASENLQHDINETISIYKVEGVSTDLPPSDSALSLDELPDFDKPTPTTEGTVNVDDLLIAARQAKKPSLISSVTPVPNKETVEEKPNVDRSTKPPTDRGLTLVPRWRSHSSYVGLTGLVNINNTCYMNTVLQCLRHLYPLMEYCFDPNYMDQVHQREPRIVVQFVKLLKILWEYESKIYRPEEFYYKFIESFSMYGAGHHEDATEFFIHLFSALNDDCTLTEAERPDEETSIFTEMFYYRLEMDYGCTKCAPGKSNLRREYENIMYLYAPTHPFNLLDSIDRYLHNEHYKCNSCRRGYRYIKRFIKYPKIMTIALKRYVPSGIGHQFDKTEAPCKFPYELQLGSKMYILKSIILHSGTIDSGHYTAVCHNPHDQKWYLYNDDSVSAINMDTSPDVAKCAYTFFYCLKY